MACRWEKVRMATLSGQHDLAQKLMPAERPDAGRFHFATDAEAGDLTWLRLLVRSGQARQALPAIAQRLAQAQFMQRGWRAQARHSACLRAGRAGPMQRCRCCIGLSTGHG
jgi:LuxR family maltose regulon positive regulatory protein